MTGSPAASTSRIFDRHAVVLGVAVAVIAGITLAIGAAQSGRAYLFNSDADYFLRVARDPFGDGETFVGLPQDVAVSYRYGRILYPLLGWVLALGRPSLVAWTLPIVYAAALGLMASCAVRLLASQGIDGPRGALVVLVPSMWVTIPIVFSDPLVVSLLLLTYLLAAHGRTAGAWLAAAALILTREAAAVAVLPLGWAAYRRRDVRGAALWLATVLPTLAWWVWVRLRVGDLPPLDPGLGRAVALPLAGPVTVIREGEPIGGWFLAALVLGGLTVAASVWVWVRAPWFPVSQGALAFGVLVACLGPAGWRLPLQAIRLMLPAQALIALAALRLRAPGGSVKARGHPVEA